MVDGLVVDTVELAVANGDVVHRISQLRVFVAHNHDAVLRLLAGDVLHGDVAYGGIESTTANLAWLVVSIDFQHRLATLTDGDVAHVDVLDDAATARVGLDAQHTVQRGRVHLAVLGIDILATTGNLGTDHHTTMAVVELAIADDDVLRRCAGKTALATLTAVVVASALDGNAVVASIEETVLNQHAVARLGVAAVTVGTIVVDVHTTYGNVLRQQGMNDPERRAQQGNVLNEDALALVEVYHLGTQTVSRSETALVHVNTVFSLLQQSGTGTHVLGYAAFLHAKLLAAAPGPPCVVGTTAIDDTLTCDGNVAGLIGVNQR